MRKIEKIKAKLSDIFELPQDVILNLPSILLTGNLNLILENHRGIIKYEAGIVEIRVYHGKVIIVGSNLMIESLEEERIIITGKITDLRFEL